MTCRTTHYECGCSDLLARAEALADRLAEALRRVFTDEEIRLVEADAEAALAEHAAARGSAPLPADPEGVPSLAEIATKADAYAGNMGSVEGMRAALYALAENVRAHAAARGTASPAKANKGSAPSSLLSPSGGPGLGSVCPACERPEKWAGHGHAPWCRAPTPDPDDDSDAAARGTR